MSAPVPIAVALLGLAGAALLGLAGAALLGLAGAALLGLAGAALWVGRGRGAGRGGGAGVPATRARRILFPFFANALSGRALDAALRLAIADDAVLVPVFLVQVPLHLSLDTPLPRESGVCLSLQEAVEQRAHEAGVAVDARVERGRTYRHGLAQAIGHEHFDRLVIAASAQGGAGFDADDVAWLLENAPGEIVVLRPGEEARPPGRRRRPARRRRQLSRGYEMAASR